VFVRLSAAEDVEEHVVTKTTKIVQKSAPETGLFVVQISVLFCTLSLNGLDIFLVCCMSN